MSSNIKKEIIERIPTWIIDSIPKEFIDTIINMAINIIQKDNNNNNAKEFNFYYGSMGSGKTALLLIKYYNSSKDNGIPTLLLKPLRDDRYGVNYIQSRIGLKAEAVPIAENDDIFNVLNSLSYEPKIIMLDEVQFFSTFQIEQLKDLADDYGIKVEAYGLMRNFRGNLFGEETGSIKKVLEKQDNIIQIPSLCACGSNAGNIARYDPETWEIKKDGLEIVIGGNNMYTALCHKHWNGGIVPIPSRIRSLELQIEEEVVRTEVNIERLQKLRETLERYKEQMGINNGKPRIYIKK